MTDEQFLEEVDVDGALREAAAEVASGTRASFLRKAGLGGAALLAGGAVAGALPTLAMGATLPASDVSILNFALTLEYLESAFYTEANAKGGLNGQTRRFAQIVANHEHSHVTYLQGLLGGKAVAQPKFNFLDTTSNQAKFQATADGLENTGVHAYLGQLGSIKNKTVLAGAGRILPVEARHASWIRDIRYHGGSTPGTTPAPAPFEDGFSMTAILGIVHGTGFMAS